MTWEITVRLVPPGEPGVVTRVGATSLALMQLSALPWDLGEYEADADDLLLRLEIADGGRTAEGLRDLAGTAGTALAEAAPELAGWAFVVDVAQLGTEPEPEPVDSIEDYRAAVYSAARLLQGLPAQGEALAGCLIQGAELMIDQLFDDLRVLDTADGPVDFDEFLQLSGLPPQHRDQYTPDFVRAFIVAATDLSSRLTGTWTDTACLAHDLAFERLLDTAQEIADAVALELPDRWREQLFSKLIRKNDVASPAFEDWFTPYGPGHSLPPYVMPYPSAGR